MQDQILPARLDFVDRRPLCVKNLMGSIALPQKNLSMAGEEAGSSWLEDACQTSSLRKALPPSCQRKPFQVSQILQLFKDFLGRDLAEVEDLALPVGFCEPISDVQRRGEFLEYTELLDQAAQCEAGSVERLLAVTAYAFSIYSCVTRALAPFRSYAGETLEVTSKEKGIRALGEKCGECPGVNALICQGRGWELSADEVNCIQFRGTHAHFRPTGLVRVAFPDGEELCWNPLLTTVKNLLIGAMRLSHSGELHVRSSASGLAARLNFSEPLLSLQPTYGAEGALERDGVPLSPPMTLEGRWNAPQHRDAKLESIAGGKRTLLWAKNPPPQPPCRYNLSSWSVTLGDRPPGVMASLPPSDVRHRGDIRLLEAGKYDEAESERQRILSRLRKARKAAAKKFEPRWFTLHPEVSVGEGKRLTYKGGYFETRAAVRGGTGSWEGCPDLYGPDNSTTAIY